MNTPLKIQEEEIWTTWYRHLFGDNVYLVSNISHDDSHPMHNKPSGVDHQEVFLNPGHIPGCCHGLQLGLDHLKAIGFEGIVVLTVPDAIADEGFKDILKADLAQDVYAHDWGPDHVAMDFVLLHPEAWKDYELPKLLGYVGNQTPVMEDYLGKFMAPAQSAELEKWHTKYLSSTFTYTVFSQQGLGGPGWGTNVGTWFLLNNCDFRVIQSGGDARPTKTHTTDKYNEFDIR